MIYSSTFSLFFIIYSLIHVDSPKLYIYNFLQFRFRVNHKRSIKDKASHCDKTESQKNILVAKVLSNHYERGHSSGTSNPIGDA